MKALTVYQPWASLIIAGAKPYEFRKWDFASRMPQLIGQRVVIHASSRLIKLSEVRDIMGRLESGETGLLVDIARPIVERALAEPHVFPLSAGLGTVIMRQPISAVELFGGVFDSDRLDHTKFGWPLTDIVKFEPPAPARGHQGFWNWPENR
jgi:hypothetical protein